MVINKEFTYSERIKGRDEQVTLNVECAKRAPFCFRCSGIDHWPQQCRGNQGLGGWNSHIAGEEPHNRDPSLRRGSELTLAEFFACPTIQNTSASTVSRTSRCRPHRTQYVRRERAQQTRGDKTTIPKTNGRTENGDTLTRKSIELQPRAGTR